jgi:signal recognition particle subunit SRP54
MFDNLKDQLTNIFSKLTSKGTLSEEDINNAMREIRIALLEADVALPVAKQFIEKVRERAIGQEIIRSITPGQMVIKIVQDELIEILGSKHQELNLSIKPPAIIMLVGLQGSGKTTSCAKLALHLKNKLNKKSMLASLDIARPAAQQQLEILANSCNISSLPITSNQTPIEITKRAIKEAELSGCDVLILDTAGRLHIAEELMQELTEIQKLSKPIETILVVDSLTGQDAINIAKHFQEKLELTGIILTRLDGDHRGGAALSMRHATNIPIKFIGIGEKLEDFSAFYPDRIASRILDKGDIVSLVEKAAQIMEHEDAEKMAKKIQKGRFDMNDLLAQLKNISKMGGLSSMISLLPGLGGKVKDLMSQNSEFNEKIISRQVAIISSMTKQERRNPDILNASRKIRIAQGSGTHVQDINKLIKQFLQMSKAMKKVAKLDKKSLLRNGMKNIFN